MAAGSDEDDARSGRRVRSSATFARSRVGRRGRGRGTRWRMRRRRRTAIRSRSPWTRCTATATSIPNARTTPGRRRHPGYRADDDATTCPVCFRPLQDLADTDATELAHVNACLDAEEWRDEEDDGHPVSDESPPFAPSDTREDDDAGATWDEGGEGEWHDVAAGATPWTTKDFLSPSSRG